METKVDRSKLLTTLRTNRDNHKSVYETAYNVYSERLIADLKECLRQAKDRKSVRVYSSLPIPEDHTEDYDAVIALLEISEDTSIELDDGDARKYVLDRWEWERSYTSNTLYYTSGK